MITRDQISRKLDFDENTAPIMRASKGGIDNLDHKKKVGKGKTNPTSDSNKPQLRARTNKPNSPVRYDLTKMTTAEVDDLLGNGPDPETSNVKKSLAESKKKENALRIDVVSTVNNTVAGLKNINDEDDADKMDDTVPLSEGEMIEDRNDDDNGRHKEDDGSKEGTDSVAAPDHGSVPAPNHSTVAASTVGSTMERCDKINQTDPVLIFCGCDRCQGLFSGFNNLVLAASKHDCGTVFKTNKDISGILFNNDSMEFSGNRNGDTKVPLFVGSSIMISLTDKTLLKNLDDETPKEYVNFIMDAIYDPTEMAMMTANGRTKGSTKMDKKIKVNLHAYIQHKFKGQKITRKLLNKLINAKCYCERRKLWNKQKALGDSEDIAVRKPLKKFTRDPNKPRKVANPGKKNKEKKKASKLHRESKGVSQQVIQRHPKQKISLDRNSPKKNITPTKFNRKPFQPASYSSPAFSPIKRSMPKKNVLKSKREEGDRPVTGGKRPRPISEILGGDKHASLSASSTPFTSAKKPKRDEAGTRESGLDVIRDKRNEKESSHREKESSHREKEKESSHREKEKESSHREKKSSHRKDSREQFHDEDDEYEVDYEYEEEMDYGEPQSPIPIDSSADEDDDDDDDDEEDISDIQTD